MWTILLWLDTWYYLFLQNKYFEILIHVFSQVVQRIDDGARLTDGLAQMLSERAELEMKYAKGLKQWSRKWEDAVNKSPEYGSLENAVKSLTVEANETAGRLEFWFLFDE